MRIIAGTHRGRRIVAPKGMATRPTTDRVRESLFAVLGEIGGHNVVDCYAGSGGLGLEALSRGASRATFIESGREAAACIQSNAKTLELSERVVLLRMGVEKAKPHVIYEHWDLILSDPPWPICQAAALAVLKFASGHMNPGGRLALGHPRRQPLELPVSDAFELIDTRNWGDSAFTLLAAR
jgi:16S rRNA (guanine(966)-N(2))-methyltransferase RsmD